MGMNYYLVKKKAYELIIEDGISLSNFPTPTVYHIGKSSFGWHFLLCQYSEIRTFEDWRRMFINDQYVIVDEECRPVKMSELIERISNRKGKISQKEYTEYFKKNLIGNAKYDAKHKLFMHPSDICPKVSDSVTYDLTDDVEFC